MSIINDIRIIAAQNLSLPSVTRYKFLELLRAIDHELDVEGYEPSESVIKHLRAFEVSLLDVTEEITETNEADIFDDVLDDTIDIDDIDLIDPSTEE